jgi:hypothetical protein
MYGALNVPRPCRHAGRPDTGKKQAETAGFLACQGMLHKYPAAARDDRFLAGQDLHEAAAPMGGLLPNSKHRIPEPQITASRSLCQSQFSIAVDMRHGFKPSPRTRSPDLGGTAS